MMGGMLYGWFMLMIDDDLCDGFVFDVYMLWLGLFMLMLLVGLVLMFIL